MKNSSLAESLDYDPFEGDFGDGNDRIFTDKIVKSRKIYECSQCLGEINKNEIYRSLVAKFDGSLRQFRWCSDCCVAMIAELENWNSEDIIDEFPFEKRFNLFKSGVV